MSTWTRRSVLATARTPWATMMPRAGCSPRPPRRSDRRPEGDRGDLGSGEIVDPGATGEVTFPAGRVRGAEFPSIGGPSLSSAPPPTLLREEAGHPYQPDRSP